MRQCCLDVTSPSTYEINSTVTGGVQVFFGSLNWKLKKQNDLGVESSPLVYHGQNIRPMTQEENRLMRMALLKSVEIVHRGKLIE